MQRKHLFTTYIHWFATLALVHVKDRVAKPCTRLQWVLGQALSRKSFIVSKFRRNIRLWIWDSERLLENIADKRISFFCWKISSVLRFVRILILFLFFRLDFTLCRQNITKNWMNILLFKYLFHQEKSTMKLIQWLILYLYLSSLFTLIIWCDLFFFLWLHARKWIVYSELFIWFDLSGIWMVFSKRNWVAAHYLVDHLYCNVEKIHSEDVMHIVWWAFFSIKLRIWDGFCNTTLLTPDKMYPENTCRKRTKMPRASNALNPIYNVFHGVFYMTKSPFVNCGFNLSFITSFAILKLPSQSEECRLWIKDVALKW